MTGSPSHRSFNKQSLFLSCMKIQIGVQDWHVTPQCRLFVSDCSAGCGSGASEERRNAEVWGVSISAKCHYYLKVSSIKVTAPLDFTLSVCSLEKDPRQPWPHALQPDSVWTPGALSWVHVTLGSSLLLLRAGSWDSCVQRQINHEAKKVQMSPCSPFQGHATTWSYVSGKICKVTYSNCKKSSPTLPLIHHTTPDAMQH